MTSTQADRSWPELGAVVSSSDWTAENGPIAVSPITARSGPSADAATSSPTRVRCSLGEGTVVGWRRSLSSNGPIKRPVPAAISLITSPSCPEYSASMLRATPRIRRTRRLHRGGSVPLDAAIRPTMPAQGPTATWSARAVDHFSPTAAPAATADSENPMPMVCEIVHRARVRRVPILLSIRPPTIRMMAVAAR